VSPGLVVALTVAATAGAMLSMATKDRVRALGLPGGPERAIAFLLGGRDGRLLLVAVFAVFGLPVAALAAVAVPSWLSLTVRVVAVQRSGRGGTPRARHSKSQAGPSHPGGPRSEAEQGSRDREPQGWTERHEWPEDHQARSDTDHVSPGSDTDHFSPE